MLQPLAERHRALSVPELGAAPGAERVVGDGPEENEHNFYGSI